MHILFCASSRRSIQSTIFSRVSRIFRMGTQAKGKFPDLCSAVLRMLTYLISYVHVENLLYVLPVFDLWTPSFQDFG